MIEKDRQPWSPPPLLGRVQVGVGALWWCSAQRHDQTDSFKWLSCLLSSFPLLLALEMAKLTRTQWGLTRTSKGLVRLWMWRVIKKGMESVSAISWVSGGLGKGTWHTGCLYSEICLLAIEGAWSYELTSMGQILHWEFSSFHSCWAVDLVNSISHHTGVFSNLLWHCHAT